MAKEIGPIIHGAVSKVAPISGVSIGDAADKSTWRITFLGEATAEDRQAAEGMIASLDINELLRQPAAFVARDLLDMLTTDDLVAIRTTIASNVSLDLLWTRMTGRGDKPISTGSPGFVAGWAGLVSALGVTRAAAISAGLGITRRETKL